jgi:hypothetical protein
MMMFDGDHFSMGWSAIAFVGGVMGDRFFVG